MKFRRVLWPLLIGLLGWAAAIIWIERGGYALAKAQVQASDIFMLSPQGPRLGVRPVSDEIVLLYFDYKTANELGYVRNYKDDVQVYRKLLEAGAKVVYDARSVIAATPEAFSECHPLLDDMLSLDTTGRLLRDVWLSSALMVEHGPKYGSLCTQNVVDSHPHAMPGIASRIYPVAYFSASGFLESAPLILYRKLRDMPRLSPAEVGESMRNSGIMSQWHRLAPDQVPKTDVPKSSYPLGDRSITWQPFVSSVNLVPPAGFWVSYDPPVSGYQRLSYLDVMKAEALQAVQGKAVLIGYSADVDPSSNTFELPNLVGKAPTIDLMACALQTLLDHRDMQAVPRWLVYSIALVMIISIALLTGLAKPLQALAGSLCILFLYLVSMTMMYRAGWYPDFFVTPIVCLATAVPAASYNLWVNLRARQRVIDLFGRYVPRAIVNQLVQRADLQTLTLGGTKREVTVMFADIRGFTSFSQYLPPEKVVHELNSLLEVMVKCTFEYEGTLDKFIGDAILVLFNAPTDQPDHALRAVRTAIAIQQQLRNHASGLKVGIGVHSGPAVIGNIGTAQRMEFTAIGRTVNVASRLCDLASPGEIVVSSTVTSALGGEIAFEPLDSVSVKGISDKLEVARIPVE